MNLVHLSDKISQPYIRIKCSQKWAMANILGVTTDTYETLDDEHFTFDKYKVTCRKCAMPTKEEFLKAYSTVFPFATADEANGVYEEFKKPPEEMMANIAAVCEDIVKGTK